MNSCRGTGRSAIAPTPDVQGPDANLPSKRALPTRFMQRSDAWRSDELWRVIRMRRRCAQFAAKLQCDCGRGCPEATSQTMIVRRRTVILVALEGLFDWFERDLAQRRKRRRSGQRSHWLRSCRTHCSRNRNADQPGVAASCLSLSSRSEHTSWTTRPSSSTCAPSHSSSSLVMR